jgi:hypothetical protein
VSFWLFTAQPKCVSENSSFAQLGLDHFPQLYPRLTPWASFFGHFAARNRWPCSTLSLQNKSHAHTESRALSKRFMRHALIAATHCQSLLRDNLVVSTPNL